jgi:hypothetical protein
MQKLADGQDTDAGSSPPRPPLRCAAVPQADAVPDVAAAGWPLAVAPAAGPGGAGDDPLHPAAAPASSTDTQPSASRSRPVVTQDRLAGDVPVNAALCAPAILLPALP